LFTAKLMLASRLFLVTNHFKIFFPAMCQNSGTRFSYQVTPRC